jgi:hypothetical protein
VWLTNRVVGAQQIENAWKTPELQHCLLKLAHETTTERLASLRQCQNILSDDRLATEFKHF